MGDYVCHTATDGGLFVYQAVPVNFRRQIS